MVVRLVLYIVKAALSEKLSYYIWYPCRLLLGSAWVCLSWKKPPTSGDSGGVFLYFFT